MSRCFAYKGNTRRLEPIAKKWQEEAKGRVDGIDMSMDDFLNDLQSLVDSPDCDLLCLDQEGYITGFIGVQAFKSPLGKQIMTNEHYWYVLPDKRGISSVRLVKAAIEWAKEKGCSHIILNASKLAGKSHDMVCKLYEKLGMSHFETSYIKRC